MNAHGTFDAVIVRARRDALVCASYLDRCRKLGCSAAVSRVFRKLASA